MASLCKRSRKVALRLTGAGKTQARAKPVPGKSVDGGGLGERLPFSP